MNIDKFMGEKSEIKINGETLVIKPLTFKELKEVMKMAETNNTDGITQSILLAGLKPSLGDKYDNKQLLEIAEGMDSKVALKIIKAVQKASGLGDDSGKKEQAEEEQ